MVISLPGLWQATPITGHARRTRMCFPGGISVQSCLLVWPWPRRLHTTSQPNGSPSAPAGLCVMPHDTLCNPCCRANFFGRMFIRCQRYQQGDRVATQGKQNSTYQPSIGRPSVVDSSMCTRAVHGQPASRTSARFQVGLRCKDLHRARRWHQRTCVRARKRGCGLYGASAKQGRFFATSATLLAQEPSDCHPAVWGSRLGFFDCFQMRHNWSAQTRQPSAAAGLRR